MSRTGDINRLYNLFEELERRVGGKQLLDDCTGYMDWPERGIYFFFAPDETRESTNQLRLTRIGTHAVTSNSKTSLWNRLRNHRGTMGGTYQGGGNHRGSVFRKRVGEALIERDGLDDAYPHWGIGSSANRNRRINEIELERKVSDYLRNLPFLWAKVDDEPSATSQRGYIERNAIALLSNYERSVIDARSDDWLGKYSQSVKIRQSGLWNVNHVDEEYELKFLDTLHTAIGNTHPL